MTHKFSNSVKAVRINFANKLTPVAEITKCVSMARAYFRSLQDIELVFGYRLKFEELSEILGTLKINRIKVNDTGYTNKVIESEKGHALIWSNQFCCPVRFSNFRLTLESFG